MNIEKLKSQKEAIKIAGLFGGTVALVGLTAVATALTYEEPPEQTPEPEVLEEVVDVGVTHHYLDNGTRLTEYSAGGFADVLSICDGIYIVDQTEYMYGTRAASGNAIARTEAPIICADGKLTPEDFKIPG